MPLGCVQNVLLTNDDQPTGRGSVKLFQIFGKYEWKQSREMYAKTIIHLSVGEPHKYQLVLTPNSVNNC